MYYEKRRGGIIHKLVTLVKKTVVKSPQKKKPLLELKKFLAIELDVTNLI
jgi:hypothetical protein